MTRSQQSTTAPRQPNRAFPPTQQRGRCWGPVLVLAAVIAMTLGVGSASAATTLYVSADAAGDPACAAASQANPFRTPAGALACAVNGTTIDLGPGTFDGPIEVTRNVTLAAAGASTVIARPADQTDRQTPIIHIDDGHTVTIRKLTVDGRFPTAPGIVAGSGSLTVSQATIVNNANFGSAGDGGGISVVPATGTAKVTVANSTIASNIDSGYGGGIYVASASSSSTPSTLTVVNSTIINNGGTYGTGIGVRQSNLTVRNSTIARNYGSSFGSIYGVNPISTPARFTLDNSVVESYPASGGSGIPAECTNAGSWVTDGGHNVLASPCSGFADGANGNQAGTMQSPLDPGLGPLASNGGPTQTAAPLLGSPVIGAGDASDCQAKPVAGLDQRGRPRNPTTRAVCDVGAYDTGGTPLQTLYVNKKAASDPACADASSSNPFATLAAALACADNGTLVKVAPGTYAGQVTIDRNVVVQGAGASTVIAGPTMAVLGIRPDVTISAGRFVALKSLTIDGIDGFTTGVAVAGSTLTVLDSTITRNADYGSGGQGGGGINALSAPGREVHVTVVRSTIDHNRTNLGGGGIDIHWASGGVNQGNTLDLIDSTVAANIADGGAGQGGGGIAADGTAKLSIRSSTIAGNSSSSYGGGISGSPSTSPVQLTNSIVAGNTAPTGPDCLVAISRQVIDGGFNVIGQNTGTAGSGCPGLADGVNGDHVGTADAPLDAHLGPLQSNGGPTQTMALLAGSPAIGAGDTADCLALPANGLDERGSSRHVNARHACDIGAYDTGGAAL